MKAESTTIFVEVDQLGEDLPEPIPVLIEYVTLVDRSYGEDADGNRGTELIEYMITASEIDGQYKGSISKELADWAIKNAEHVFLTGN